MDVDGQLFLTPGLATVSLSLLDAHGAGSPGKMLHWQTGVGTSVFHVAGTMDVGQR